MPKLHRWLIASKTVDVFDHETLETIESLGGHVCGGWGEIHQHICVNKDNKERIEALLEAQGFSISYPEDHRIFHPEYYVAHEAESHTFAK
jgi:hypothetical protein